jgi:glyoxylase-like metal-dependent hydrolase (beta-lactamase superfamily II)
MQIGDMRIDSLIDGEAALDPHAGIFVGDNPPTEADWEPFNRFLDPCTGQMINTVGSYLIRYGDRVVLQDTGMGPQIGGQEVFACGALRSSMWAAGVSPLDVTDIIFSHLHTDHIGWTTINGKPYFPNATIHIDRRDWDHYTSPDSVLEDWEPNLMRSEEDKVENRFKPVLDRIEFFEGDQEILPGINAMEASGHTPGHTVLELSSRGEKGLLIGDLVHSHGELVDGWEFFFNRDLPKAIEAVERFRKLLYDTNLPFAAAHFPGMKWGKLVKGDAGQVAYETI